ncbi:hypothetical protein FISHEDRAFT_34648 [Fistulina hepatica ATCC 64428]|uniref:EF-hand domain-containing protein n=1 Tax=Fistulina hepatica ATCC 64428 TaxID=1128425 RepID=A0A0D7ALM9_9AGAR|nr:hypothetical protein FISHEDRAFT_34648 [Fistulina hepatica ATCC 64428]
MRLVPLLLLLAGSVLGHGDVESDGPADGETMQQYAERHMSSEHHIDSFDLPSFFQLHDLNGDKLWSRDEIEAIYGVHHEYMKKKSKDEAEQQEKAEFIVNAVLEKLDHNKDGVIDLDEFASVGLAGLPNFEDLGAEGHHYDVESEFFLHHEEKYHSTPDTQTDESYTHPEDFEHFGHHEQIEREEAEKEAQYQGITVEEALAQHESPIESNQRPLGSVPKVNRVTPPEKLEPEERFKDAEAQASSKSEWGTGEEGFKTPKNPSDRLRKNLPYKYKFRRNWGDF